MPQRKSRFYDSRRLRNILLQKVEFERAFQIIQFFHNLLIESLRYLTIDKQTQHNYKKYRKDRYQEEFRIEPKWYDEAYWHVKFYGNIVYVYRENLNGPLEQATGVHATSGELIGFRKSIIITRKKQLDLI